MNPNYEQIAKGFVTQYYAWMDGDTNTRSQLGALYSVCILFILSD